MAKTTSTSSTEKEPGRLRQLIDIFSMTAKHDKPGVAIMIAALVLPVLIAITYVAIFDRESVLAWIITIVLGLLVGILLFMFTLNWRAERVAYSRLEGQKGATGAVLSSSLRGAWRTSDMPVAFNPRTQDVVFRAVGKPGVVLFTESSNANSKKLLVDETRKMKRVLPNVPVHQIRVGTGEGDVRLGNLKREVRKLPNAITKAEVLAIDGRLASLSQNQLPIPKGVDPNKMRASRSQMR